MSYTFTTIDGCRVEVNVAAAFNRMAVAFLRDTGCSLHVRDGSRTREEQQAEWDRYQRYGAPVAAYPGTSNHEIDGPNGPRSIDIYDSGDDPGVTSRGSARDGWMERNAGSFGFENEGYNFGEAWHKTFRGDIGGSGQAPVEANQRVAGSGGVNARKAPNRTSGVVAESYISEGEVGTFAGWVKGENVDGIDIWLKGAFSGLYFWLGGFTQSNTAGLPQLDAPTTLQPNQRQADGDGVRGRKSPSTSSEQVTFLEPNDVSDFDGWATGEAVQGESRWIRGKYTGAWFWLGGFTQKNVDGLPQVNSTTPPVVTPPTKPKDTVDDASVPGTFTGQWSDNCEERTGNPGDYFIVHHAADPREASVQLQRFMNPNDRDVSCTWFMGKDGTAYKVVRPSKRQWTTGRIIDQKALTVETQNTTGAPSWGISDESHEGIAKLVAWWHKTYGGKIDREHVLGHSEARAKLDPSIPATACPGPSMDLDRIVKCALELVDPPVVTPPDTIPVDRSWLQSIFDKLKSLLGK